MLPHRIGDILIFTYTEDGFTDFIALRIHESVTNADFVYATAVYEGEKIFVAQDGTCSKPLPYVIKPATESDLRHIIVDPRTMNIEYHSKDVGGPKFKN